MPQRFPLDGLRWAPYLCLLVGCAKPSTLDEVGPLPSVAVAEANRWIAVSTPTGHQLIRFRWLFNDGNASVGGHGSARIAGPDSMRFDIAGPWGIGGAAAMVVADDAEWVRPPDIIARLIPSYPLMWAMFGVMRPPPPGSRPRGMRTDVRTIIEWTDGADTVRYLRVATELQAVWQRAGTTMGVVVTRLDPDGTPASSRLTVPSVPARLDVTIVADSGVPAFPPSVWSIPAP